MIRYQDTFDRTNPEEQLHDKDFDYVSRLYESMIGE